MIDIIIGSMAPAGPPASKPGLGGGLMEAELAACAPASTEDCRTFRPGATQTAPSGPAQRPGADPADSRRDGASQGSGREKIQGAAAFSEKMRKGAQDWAQLGFFSPSEQDNNQKNRLNARLSSISPFNTLLRCCLKRPLQGQACGFCLLALLLKAMQVFQTLSTEARRRVALRYFKYATISPSLRTSQDRVELFTMQHLPPTGK